MKPPLIGVRGSPEIHAAGPVVPWASLVPEGCSRRARRIGAVSPTVTAEDASRSLLRRWPSSAISTGVGHHSDRVTGTGRDRQRHAWCGGSSSVDRGAAPRARI